MSASLSVTASNCWLAAKPRNWVGSTRTSLRRGVIAVHFFAFHLVGRFVRLNRDDELRREVQITFIRPPLCQRRRVVQTFSRKASSTGRQSFPILEKSWLSALSSDETGGLIRVFSG